MMTLEKAPFFRPEIYMRLPCLFTPVVFSINTILYHVSTSKVFTKAFTK